MSLQGAPELRRRLRAIKQTFKPAGRDWADRTVVLAKRRVKRKTGATQRSIRRRNASMKRAAVVATHGARFLEGDTKAHEISPRRMTAMKFNAAGQPRFAKKVRHPGTRKQPFMVSSASQALRETPILAHLIELWNRAA